MLLLVQMLPQDLPRDMELISLRYGFIYQDNDGVFWGYKSNNTHIPFNGNPNGKHGR